VRFLCSTRLIDRYGERRMDLFRESVHRLRHPVQKKRLRSPFAPVTSRRSNEFLRFGHRQRRDRPHANQQIPCRRILVSVVCQIASLGRSDLNAKTRTGSAERRRSGIE
jgi:hypothetical protein